MFKQLVFHDIVAIAIVMLLMLMTVYPTPILLYAVIGGALLFVRHPLVVFPAYFVASLSNTYFGLSKLSEDGMSVGRFLAPIMILSLLISIIRKGKHKSDPNTQALVLLFIVYCFFSSCFSITGTLAPFVVIVQSLLILLLFPMIKDVDLERTYRLIWISSFIVVLGLWLYVVRGGGMDLLMNGRFNREGEVNANRIAMLCAQVGVALISPFFTTKSIFLRIFSVVGYILTLLLIFFTGSRAGGMAVLLAPFIVFLMFSFSLKKVNNNNKHSHAFVLFAVFAIILFIFFSKLESLDAKVMTRFSLESLEETGGGGRVGAIEVMWHKIFPRHPIFGVGLGGANFVALSTRYGVYHPCHNIIIDSLCQLGIIGFLIFICLIIKAIMPCVKLLTKGSNTQMILPLILFFAALINGIGETLYLEKFFWNAATLCLVSCANYKNQINVSI